MRLATGRRLCQSRTMTDVPDDARRPGPRGGGCLVALGLLGGATIGVAVGQGSLGILFGLAAGLLAALVMFLRDRN